MRILSFNHHESFLASFAAIGEPIDIVTRYGSLDLSWNRSSVPVPKNVRLVPFDHNISKALKNGAYDRVVCHTVKNLLWMLPYPVPITFVAHIPLFHFSARTACKSIGKKLIFKFCKTVREVDFTAVSEFKRQSWNEEGAVIPLAPSTYLERRKTTHPKVITVGNNILGRKKELGWELLHAVQKEVLVTVIGKNPGLNGAREPGSRAEFIDEFSQGSIYLYTVSQPIGDGYNTAMLEAMAAGMAVVSIENPSSPIVHGHNGLIGRNAKDLSARVRYLRDHPQELERLGRNGQKTIAEKFSPARFVAGWKEVLAVKDHSAQAVKAPSQA